MTHSSQRITAFFLLIILTGNTFFSIFWSPYVANVWHDHIILGPVFPGWEDHHSEVTRSGQHHDSDSEPGLSAGDEQTVPTETDSGVGTRIISLFRSPTGDDTVLCLGVQIIWLAEWLPVLPEPSSLNWPLNYGALTISDWFLIPPDRPPSTSLQ